MSTHTPHLPAVLSATTTSTDVHSHTGRHLITLGNTAGDWEVICGYLDADHPEDQAGVATSSRPCGFYQLCQRCVSDFHTRDADVTAEPLERGQFFTAHGVRHSIGADGRPHHMVVGACGVAAGITSEAGVWVQELFETKGPGLYLVDAVFLDGAGAFVGTNAIRVVG